MAPREGFVTPDRLLVQIASYNTNLQVCPTSLLLSLQLLTVRLKIVGLKRSSSRSC